MLTANSQGRQGSHERDPGVQGRARGPGWVSEKCSLSPATPPVPEYGVRGKGETETEREGDRERDLECEPNRGASDSRRGGRGVLVRS